MTVLICAIILSILSRFSQNYSTNLFFSMKEHSFLYSIRQIAFHSKLKKSQENISYYVKILHVVCLEKKATRCIHCYNFVAHSAIIYMTLAT